MCPCLVIFQCLLAARKVLEVKDDLVVFGFSFNPSDVGFGHVLSAPLKYESLSLHVTQSPYGGLRGPQDLAPVAFLTSFFTAHPLPAWGPATLTC